MKNYFMGLRIGNRLNNSGLTLKNCYVLGQWRVFL